MGQDERRALMTLMAAYTKDLGKLLAAIDAEAEIGDLEARVRELADPEGEHDGECAECEGDGRVECDNCSGMGECACSNCEEEHTCGKCDGEGTMICPQCDGERAVIPVRRLEGVPEEIGRALLAEVGSLGGYATAQQAAYYALAYVERGERMAACASWPHPRPLS
jgi:hypothetical protein